MADIAQIGFKAETRELDDARKKLEAIKPAAASAEKAADTLAGELKRTNGAFSGISDGASGASKAFSDVKSTALSTVVGITGFTAAITAASLALSSFGGFAKGASAELRKLSTLFEGDAPNLVAYGKAAEQLALQFGTDKATQIRSFYDVLSKSGGDVQSSTEIVNASNKLLKLGIDDSRTSIDALTTAVNIYGQTGVNAGNAADIIYTGFKRGSTNLEDFTESVREMVPEASRLGVSFRDTVAGISALTNQGQEASDAMSSFREILQAVREPSDDVREAAKEMGINFSVAGIKAQGFSGFMQELATKTGGSQEKLEKLFESTEALDAVMALTTQKGNNFKSTIDALNGSAGATDLAYKKMSDTIENRVSIAIGSLLLKFTSIGESAKTALLPLMEGILGVLNGTSSLIPVFVEIATASAIAFSPLIIGGMVTAVAGLISSLAVGLVGAIGSATAAMVAFSLSNPFTAIALAITTTLAAAYIFRDALSQMLGFDIVDAAKTGANGLIASLVGGYEYIVAVWNNLPAIVGGAAINAANATLSAISKMVNGAIEGINSMVAALPEFLRGSTEAIKFRMEEGERITNKFAVQSSVAMAAAKDSLNKAFETDHIGKFTDALKTAGATATNTASIAKKIAVDTGVGSKTADDSDGGGGGGKKSKGAGEAEKELTALQKIAEGYKQLSEPFNQATTAFNAAKSAMENGLITNAQYVESIAKIKDAYIAAGGSSEQFAKIASKGSEDLGKQLQDLNEKSLKRVGDEFVEMAFKGKANFGQLAMSIVKDLVKIMVQAMIVKPFLGLFKGFSLGGGMGGAGGATPVAGGLYADGAAFGGGARMFAAGGSFTNSVVNKPTPFAYGGSNLGIMGEAGPEAIMPLKRGANGSLGVQMHGAGGRAPAPQNNVNVTNQFTIAGAVSREEITAAIRASADQTLEDTKKSLVGHLDQYNRDGYL